MRKQWRLVVAGLGLMLVVLLTTGILLSFPVPASQGWTQQDFLRIRSGMTLAEVQEILGAPPGDYRSMATKGDPAAADFDGCIFGTPTGIASTAIWISDSALIYLGLDPAGKVQTGAFFAQQPDSSPLRNALWRLQHQWRRWFP